MHIHINHKPTQAAEGNLVNPALWPCWLILFAIIFGTSPLTFAADQQSTGRDVAHYSADMPVNIQHMRLQLTFTEEGMKARTCDGRVEYTLQPRAKQIDTLRLEAVNMRIIGVELPGTDKAPTFSYDDKVLTILLPQPVKPDETLKVAVSYRLEEPRKGMYFVLPNASTPRKPQMVYTMSEPIEARYWVPAHDWPNARWTSDIEVTVPAPYSVVANGTLVGKNVSSDGKSATFHWRNDIPTDPHLMGLVVGELVEQREEWRGKPVLTYTQPGSEAAARFTFRHVPEMLQFYTKLIGYDFPYPSYSHITVADHHHGGMEQAGFSFVSPFYIADRDEGDWPVEGTESWLIAHMLGHQWFGGVVNYRSVSQAWLNEGFATYLDTLWTSHREMPDRLEYEMWQKARDVAGSDSSETGKPMVNRDLSDVEDIYQMDGSKVYYKGAWVVHMLRNQLGDEVFWAGIRRYLRDHEWQSVETTDLRQALEKASGRDLEQFFQQWIYGHGVPHLDVDYSWDAKKRQATVVVKQTQKISEATPAFACPLEFQFRVAGGDTNFTADLRNARDEFTYNLAAEPTLFCVDPREVLLKTLTVKVPQATLVQQVEHGPTALSRLLAVETIGREGRTTDIGTLEKVLKNESEFWAVRKTAAERIGRMQNEAALQALLRAERSGINNPRVLTAVIEALVNFVVSKDAHETVLKYADAKQPLSVESAAIRALGHMRASPDLIEKGQKMVLGAAAKPSRRAVRQVALASLRISEDTNAYEAVQELAQPARDDELRDMAIGVLGRLGRRDEVRAQTLTILRGWLYDPDRAARIAAIRALGELGDPRALADLERLSAGSQGEEVHGAAEAAIASIKRAEDPKHSIAGLVERLDTLERQSQDLEKKVKALADRAQAGTNNVNVAKKAVTTKAKK
jgi:aminopeptidase N